MISAEGNNQNSPFPMRVLCPGCGTAYKLEGARQFTCPHCGNHIRVASDGTVEFRPGTSKRGKEEPSISLEYRERKAERKDRGVKVALPAKKALPEPAVAQTTEIPEAEPVSETTEAGEETEEALKKEEPVKREEVPVEEGVVEISLSKGRAIKKKEGEGIKGIPAEKPEEERVAGKAEREREKEKEKGEKAEGKEREPAEEREEREVSSAPAPEREEERKEEREGKGEEREVEEKGLREEKEGERVEKSRVKNERRKNRFSEMTPEKKALIAVVIAGLLILSVLAYALMPQPKFSVKMAPEKIGDRGKYDVVGRIYLNAENGISTGSGMIQELNTNLKGNAIYQINSTTNVKDGFGVEHRVQDKYLYQFVRLSGYVKTPVSNSSIDDAGTIETEDSGYIDLTTNATIMNKIWNNADLHILTLYKLNSVDKGIYYPTSGSSYNLFDLRQRDYKEGDTGELAGGSFRWKGEKKEHVYKWDTLKLHITENNSASNWRSISGDVWVANECSMPVKVHMHMKIDTAKLPETERLLLAYLLPTGGTVEVDYTATMNDFSRGEEGIPWGTCTASHFTKERKGVEFDKHWNYTPLLRNDTASFDPNFSPGFAVDYAINKSDGLMSYIERHKNEVYVVDGKYTVSNGTESWQFIFGYRMSGINTQMDGYNITVNKKGDNLSINDVGPERINNPSNSRQDISQAMNIADSEGIFENMSLLHSLFKKNKIDFSGGAEFRMQNSYLHTGLSLSGFNPIVQNNVPAGYGYYLQKETKAGKNYHLIEGMIDSSNGRVIYEMDHEQTG